MLPFAHLLFHKAVQAVSRDFAVTAFFQFRVHSDAYRKSHIQRWAGSWSIKDLKDSLALYKWNSSHSSGVFLTCPPPLHFHLCNTRGCPALLDAPSVCGAALQKKTSIQATSIFAFSGFIWRMIESFPKLCSRLTGDDKNACLFITDHTINCVRALWMLGDVAFYSLRWRTKLNFFHLLVLLKKKKKEKPGFLYLK